MRIEPWTPAASLVILIFLSVAGKDVCDAAITEVYKEMKDLREELVEEEELLLVRNYMMGGILGDLDGPFQIIARWKNIILNGLTEQYFYDSINTIKTISAKDESKNRGDYDGDDLKQQEGIVSDNLETKKKEKNNVAQEQAREESLVRQTVNTTFSSSSAIKRQD